jgi:hypothetical protein
MRLFVLAALALTAFAGIMTIGPTDANAVVCARGVARAGCVGAGGAAVVGWTAQRLYVARLPPLVAGS